MDKSEAMYGIELMLARLIDAIERQTEAQQKSCDEITLALVGIANRIEDIGRYL